MRTEPLGAATSKAVAEGDDPRRIVPVERVFQLLESRDRVVRREKNVFALEIGTARELEIGDDERIFGGPEECAGRVWRPMALPQRRTREGAYFVKDVGRLTLKRCRMH